MQTCGAGVSVAGRRLLRRVIRNLCRKPWANVPSSDILLKTIGILTDAHPLRLRVDDQICRVVTVFARLPQGVSGHGPALASCRHHDSDPIPFLY